MTNPSRRTIRSFVAVELTDEVKHTLAAVVGELRRRDVHGLRLVRPEGIHLTLKFLGDIDASRAQEITASVADAASGHTPFRLMLGRAGSFPTAARARVLWLGTDGDTERLRSLQRDVDAALTSIGFPAEMQRFNPHLTLGRLGRRATQSDRRRAVDALAEISARHIPAAHIISVRSVSLMQSTLQPGGAVYQRIGLAPMGTR